MEGTKADDNNLANEGERERLLIKDIVSLKKANSHYIISFWDNLYERFVADKIIENFKFINELMDVIKTLEMDVRKPLYTYRDVILIRQKEKEELIRSWEEKIDVNLEAMVEKSKEKIQEFKKRFYEFIKSNPERIDYEYVISTIKLKELRDKLYEIEMFNKKQTEDKLALLNTQLSGIVENMKDDTKQMKDQLESLKTNLKENLISKLNKQDKDKENFWVDVTEEDIMADIEKCGDIFIEMIETLKDNIDTSRDNELTSYIQELRSKEYYRNRQRIDDINDVFKFWDGKVSAELKKLYDERTNKGGIFRGF